MKTYVLASDRYVYLCACTVQEIAHAYNDFIALLRGSHWIQKRVLHGALFLVADPIGSNFRPGGSNSFAGQGSGSNSFPVSNL